MKLIVGLGNPGKDYKNTRHNVGFNILDNYLGDVKYTKFKNSDIYLTTISNEKVVFIKPQTFMNLSGIAVKEVMDYYKILSQDILVIHDDLDLPECCIRIKYNSSAGGHNGIKSIINSINTMEFARLKIGIGSNNIIDTKDYVLGKMSKELINFLNEDKIKDIIDSFIINGIDKTMNDYNH